MKAKKKTNHLQEEADKIEHIPEEKNNGRDGQDKPNKAKKPRKNRFLACLRKTWARITGCMRCCTSIQKEGSAEELPTPSEINMEEGLPCPSGIFMEEELPKSSGIFMEEELPKSSGIFMEEELPKSSGINMKEELPEPSCTTTKELLGTSCINMEVKLSEPSGTVMEEFKGPSNTNTEEELPEPSGTDMEELPKTSATDKEELPEPSGTDMEDTKANVSSEEQKRENDVEENQNIETYNEEADLVKDSFVEQEIQAQYQHLNDLIHSLEDLCARCGYNATQLEILAQYDRINDQIHSLVDLHIQHYNAEDEQSGEELESKVGDNEEVKIKEVDGESIRDSQRASCEMPGPSNINSRDNESSIGKEKDDDKGENSVISINTEREECRSVESSSNGTSLEEELHKSTNTSQSGSSDYRYYFCSLEEEASEELPKSTNTSQSRGSDYRYISCSLGEEVSEKLYKSTNTSQSGSSHYEEPIPSNICMEKPEQSGEVTPATVPLTLQSFIFHDTLGIGGYGEIYLARDTIRNECVAVKVVNKRYFIGRADNFVERNILKLSHESPYLIHGLAAFHTEECVYYVMELATRGDLFDFMNENPHLDHSTIQFITSEVICGTQFMHKKGIIHRDLKPGNILLCADGHVKIADFGLAAMDANKRNRRSCVGTVMYMAPEMLRHQQYGEGVDYFAIGVIMYMMYTSEQPFEGYSDQAVRRAVLRKTLKYPGCLAPDTWNLLQGLLHKDQHQRLGVQGDVRTHPYFSNINWEDVEAKRVVPPAIMTAAFVDMNMDQILHYEEQQNKIRSKHQRIFKEFSFICPEWSHQYHSIDTIDTIETKSWMANLFARRPSKKQAN